MLEATVEWMGFPLYYAFDGAAPPPRAGAAHATIYPYGPFPTGDGKTVMVGLQNEREWAAFCATVLQDPDRQPSGLRRQQPAQRQPRHAARTHRRRVLRARCRRSSPAGGGPHRQRPRQHHGRRLGPPQLAARGRWREVETPAGAVPALLPPGATEARMDPVPAVGQQTDAILAELGCTPEDIHALHAAGAL